MFRDLEHLQVYTATEPMEERCLVSWRRPIVLLRQRSRLASGINPGMHTLDVCCLICRFITIGFARTGIPALVMTSGNLSDLPIAITPEDAEAQLAGKVAVLLHHNRPIHNRVDDSVLQVCGGQPCLIRRSRGYVPEPFSRIQMWRDHGFRCGESEHVRFGERRDDPAKSIYWRLKELGDFPVLYGIYGAVSSFVSFQSPAIGL